MPSKEYDQGRRLYFDKKKHTKQECEEKKRSPFFFFVRLFLFFWSPIVGMKSLGKSECHISCAVSVAPYSFHYFYFYRKLVVSVPSPRFFVFSLLLSPFVSLFFT